MTSAERIHFRRQINQAIREVVQQAMYDGLYPDYDDTIMELLAIAYDHMRQLTKPIALDAGPSSAHTASAL